MEAGHHSSHAVDQLEAEPEVDQHAECDELPRHMPVLANEGNVQGFGLKLMAHGGADHVHIKHFEGIVVMGLQRIDDLLAAQIERALIVLLRQADEHLVASGLIDLRLNALNSRVLDAGGRNGLANPVDIRRLLELDMHLRAALEVHSKRQRAADLRPVNAHRDQAGHTEDHGKGKEVPLQLQPIDIYAAKQFHWFSPLPGLEAFRLQRSFTSLVPGPLVPGP